MFEVPHLDMVARFGESSATLLRQIWAASLPSSCQDPLIISPTPTLLELSKPPLPSVPQRLIKDELVEFPSDPQTHPLPAEQGEDDKIHGYETDTGMHMCKHKSTMERKTKAERR
ncbi:hypothetical protein F5148DRAFT_1334019 [Russula earlei]|uniref:Uncharacterized protein n=1 Tax=Russula earlei TaxID=71964 RepID=A0ACC0TVZ8_9AGAM|nr:hypothetical protein F5148DRAFT_1334019 [Russula earlei]